MSDAMAAEDAGDQIPPGGPIEVVVEPHSAGGGLYTASVDGTLVAGPTARPYSDAAMALLLRGESPARRAALVFAGVTLRIAMISAAAGDGR